MHFCSFRLLGPSFVGGLGIKPTRAIFAITALVHLALIADVNNGQPGIAYSPGDPPVLKLPELKLCSQQLY